MTTRLLPPALLAIGCALLLTGSTEKRNARLADSPALTLTASPVGATASTAQIQELRNLPGVASLRPVFSPDEIAELKRLGQPLLAGSLRIELEHPRFAHSVLAEVRARRLPLRIEENEFRLSSAEDPILRQWALRNEGRNQGIHFDDFTTLQIPGVAGEDVGLNRLEGPAPELRPVRVAVLDTGIDWEHPLLRDRLVTKPGECEALEAYRACREKAGRNRQELDRCEESLGAVDTDSDGYAMDCRGWNVTAPRNAKTDVIGDGFTDDDLGHGTHVAGLVSSKLAPNARLIPVKVVRSAPNNPIQPQSLGQRSDPPSPKEKELRIGTAFSDLLARGMLYAIRNGAEVMNLSLAWPAGADSLMMRRMVELARARGVVIVSSAGNDSNDSRVMPCRYDSVMCVGSHGPDGAFSHFSNFGAFVDLLAPGTRILSAWPWDTRQGWYTERKGYELKNGTSMAAPMVTAAMARLLGMGFSPEEAYARLLAGARPTRSSTLRPESMPIKYSRSGNLDLAQALAADERPLILPADKSILRLDWDRASQEIPIRFRLKNFWKDAAGATIRARLIPNELSAGEAVDVSDLGATLSQSEWKLDSAWASGEVQELGTSLRILSGDLEGRMILELRVDTAGAPSSTVRIPLEIGIPVSSGIAIPGMKTLAIEGGRLPARASLRTIKNLVPGAQSYLAFEARGAEWHLTILSESEDQRAYVVQASRALPSDRASFLEIHRIDHDGDGTDEYVIISQAPPGEGSNRPVFRFDYLSASLEPLFRLEHDNVASQLSESFFWHRVDGKLVPAWVAFGLLPKLDQPPFDPWDPEYQEAPRFRFYYLTGQGARVVAEPDEQVIVQMIAPTEEQRRGGVARVLLAEGQSYVQRYHVGTVREGRLTDIQELKLDQYRMLLGIPAPQPIQPLRPDRSGMAHRSSGSAFAGASNAGALRVSFLAPQGNVQKMSHFMITPPVITESVRRLLGVFSESPESPEASSLYAESHYEMIFHDLKTGQSATTSLGRFSYVPTLIFGKIFTQAVAERADGTRIPAILIPADLGDWEGTEVIVPQYDASGSLRRLSRPAKFRLKPAEGCVALGNPIEPSAELPSQAVFFCEDRFIRIPFLK